MFYWESGYYFVETTDFANSHYGSKHNPCVYECNIDDISQTSSPEATDQCDSDKHDGRNQHPGLEGEHFW